MGSSTDTDKAHAPCISNARILKHDRRLSHASRGSPPTCSSRRPCTNLRSLLILCISCTVILSEANKRTGQLHKSVQRQVVSKITDLHRKIEPALNTSNAISRPAPSTRHLIYGERASGNGDSMEALLETLKQDLAEVDGANRAAAARQQKKDILRADLLDKQQESNARMTPRHNERRLLDSNNDADGWPVDPTLPLESQRVFDGDYIGDGKSWGDQYTGALLDWSVGGDVYGWGLNDYGQLGSGDAFSAAQSVSWAPLLVPVLRNKNVTMVSSGSEHSTAFSKEGFVWAWGRNDGGQLGLSDSTLSHCDTKSLQSNCDGPRPSKMLFPSSLSDLWGEHVVDMSSMWDHNLVVTRSGWTYAWGRNSYGQLGTGDTRDQNIPIKVKNSQSYRFVLARTGGSHSMALTAWGEVFVWGSGARGQLGQDLEGLGPRSTSARLSLEPIQVKALQGKIVIQIAAGWSHCIALTEEGEAWVWGGNEHGQLGLGDLKDRFAPVKIQDSINGKGSQIGVCISIAGGHGHTLWLNSSGMVFSAGRNDGGQLGLGDTIDRSSVSYVDIPDRVWCDTPYGSEVSASYADVVCVNSKVRTDCGRRCVGLSWRRDCGPSNVTIGLQVSDCEPLMPGSNLGREVRASEYSSFVISRDNNLFGWGLNTFGQVGIAPELWGRNVRKPRLIISMYGKNITSISGGREHTVARSDREILVIESFSPQSGPVNGNSPIYIIGQGFNTFTGALECRFAYYSNGTHTSNFPGVLWNESIYVLSVKAERFSNQRLRCFTPDVRFRNPEGEVDLEKMSESLRTLETPRNLTIWWRGKHQLKTQRKFVWSYIALPGITGLIPQGGPVTGGTYLLVTGYGFDKMLSSDVRIKFGDEGNNWMRGCILSDKLIVTVTPPSGPSDNGLMDYDGACNKLCPTGFEQGCVCRDITDFSLPCKRGIVRASLDPRNRASRRDRCPECKYVVGNVNVMVSLNGGDYGDVTFPFMYYENPAISRKKVPWARLSAPPFTAGHIPAAIADLTMSYGGPEEGGTTVDFHGKGFTPIRLGQGICCWGCSYTDRGNNIGPKCDTGSSRHSLDMPGQFTAPKVFQFGKPYPPKVWDLIHYGTWFKCDGAYDVDGCNSYNAASGIYRFEPEYNEIYAPTFRGYNKTTSVVTSCIEDCETRAEYVSDTLIRCIAPPHLINNGRGILSAGNKTLNVTVRLKVNGQDIHPECTGSDCAEENDEAAHYLYYKQPSVTSITPNGGPLMDRPLVYVYGTGFTAFAWYPLCQFGRQTVVVNRNSTTFPGWLSHTFHTNTSAWIVNDTLLLCYAPPLPSNVPRMVDEEMDAIRRAEIENMHAELKLMQDAFMIFASPVLAAQIHELQTKIDTKTNAWNVERKSFHADIIGRGFPGKDSLLSTHEDNIIYANVSWNTGMIAVPFTVTFNAQDYLDGSHVHWPRNQPPWTRLSARNQKFVYYPHPILLSSFPLGGPVIGQTQLVIEGIGFHLYNELSPWIGQYDPQTVAYECASLVIELPYSKANFNTDMQQLFKVAVAKATGCWDSIINSWTYVDTIHVKCESKGTSTENVVIYSVTESLWCDPATTNMTDCSSAVVSVNFSVTVESTAALHALVQSSRLTKDVLDMELGRQGVNRIIRIVVGASAPPTSLFLSPFSSNSTSPAPTPTPIPPAGSAWKGCYRNFSNIGAVNENWFNNTMSIKAPPYVEANSTLGWPQQDKNVGFKYVANRTTSIKCRFGNASRIAYTLETTSYFWGHLKVTEMEWVDSVYADYLDKNQLRCQTPPHIEGFTFIQISLNSREYTSEETLNYFFHEPSSITRVKPSGGPIEGNSLVTITGTNMVKYDGLVLCRFGDESFYDEYYDINLPIPRTVSPATALSSTTMICRAPERLWTGPINVPFAITLNGQDYNMDLGLCQLSVNSTNVMWDNPADPKMLVPGVVSYLDMTYRKYTLFNGCPYAYYAHPIPHTLVPAGGPIRGMTGVRVFGRGFQIFGEDVRCKFGFDTDVWVQVSETPVGKIGRDDEILCISPPHLVLTVGGKEVACTYGCLQFPDDETRCKPDLCSFNTTKRISALKKAVAEIVSVKNIYGDNNVFPHDVTVEFFREPRIPRVLGREPSIDIGFCVNCVRGTVRESNVEDSFKIIKAVRNGYMLHLMRERYDVPGIDFIEVAGDPVQVAVTLNGQDYTYRTNDAFSYYMEPTIISLAPVGGPLIRYATADLFHKQPTLVEISGTGFQNYDEKPQCNFGEFVVAATAFGDRLLKCESPWPRMTFPVDCIECVLDVWLEVSLNGNDFTKESQINYRYYLQPEFSEFSPMGGPVTGGTIVTFRGHGFNRFNDGSLRVLWGKLRLFPEETIGKTILEDDFDPTPEEVEPLPSEWGVQEDGNEKDTIAYTFEEAHDIIQEAYSFDRNQWDYGSAVISNTVCEGMDMPATRSKIDVGYLPGDTQVKRLPVSSRSLFLSGKSKGILSGRYVISKPLDLSRGFGLSFWMKHGNSSSPLPCERPDDRDELNLFYHQEMGNFRFHSNCTESCTSHVTLDWEICYGTAVSNLSTASGYQVERSRLYEEFKTPKTVTTTEYIVPRCISKISLTNLSGTDDADIPMFDITDTEWFRVAVKSAVSPSNPDTVSERYIMMPILDFTSPKAGRDSGFRKDLIFQQCTCQKVYSCRAPPCKDYCTCHFVNDTSCVLKEISQTRYRPSEQIVRHLECLVPGTGAKNLMKVEISIEYVPAYTPPDWKDIGQWQRITVFGSAKYPGYTYINRRVHQNERGRRFGINVNELSDSRSKESMVRCPRQQKCYNQKLRLMMKQPVHGQGEFDNWAMDDLSIRSAGGIISDTEIIASSPPAHMALPLTQAQSFQWKKTGKLTNRYTRGIPIEIALNNQTYEKAGLKNFCRFSGDKKPNPDEPLNSFKDIVCTRGYFNWDEPDWPFKTSIATKYANWFEGRPQTDWGEKNILFRSSISEQFIYYQHPKILEVRPSGGPTGGSTAVTVQGSGFSAFSDPIRTPKCKFGSLVSSAQVLEDNLIICRTPETLFSGYVDVTVSLNEIDFTSPILGSEYSVPFLYYEQPTVVSVTPFTGPSRGGTEINIVGFGFFQLPTPPACRFIGVSDPTVVADVPGEFVNDTLIRCRTPSIAHLCTPSYFCKESEGSMDPGWRDCQVWDTCPFTNQCPTCGCPLSPLCQSYEVIPTSPEDKGTKVTRKQKWEDGMFDTVIQISLNGICCVREKNGILSNPCVRCAADNIRCGCVGDYTTAEYDQESNFQNTFTFYREVEIMRPRKMPSELESIYLNSAWSGPFVEGSMPILFYGQYFRNTTIDVCSYRIVCHNKFDCSNPIEGNLERMFDSSYFMRSSYVMCKPPTIFGQKSATKGRFEITFSINGQDAAQYTKTCAPDACKEYEYETPENPQIVQRNQIITAVFITAFVLYIYLYRQRMIKKNAKYVADTGGEWEKPAVREAMRWQQEHQFRKFGSAYYPLWTTGSTEIGQLGIGMGLYFQYLRFMILVFAAMFALALPSIVLNSCGMAYAAYGDVPDIWIRSSIGNIGSGWLLNYPRLPAWNGQPYNFLNTGLIISIPVQIISVVLVFMDIAICIIYISATWHLKFNQTKVIGELDEDTISAADYTILVEGVPGDAQDPDEFRAFFSKYGEVADVAIGLNNGRLIDLFQARGVQELLIEEQIAKLKLYKLQALQKELKAMRKKQKKLDEKIIQLRSKSDFKSVCAFVTFNEDKGQSECIAAYQSNFIDRCRGKAKATKKFRGKYNLQVSKASEPSNVMWENLEYRGFNLTIRAFIGTICTAIMLFISLFIGVTVQSYQTSLAGASGSYLCLIGPQANDPDAQQAIQWAKYANNEQDLYLAYLRCYCAPDLSNMLEKEPVFCQPYIDNQNLIRFMALLAMAIVISVNLSLEIALNALAYFKKPHTLSGLETMIAGSVFTAQYINTGILIIIFNMKPEGIDLVLFQQVGKVLNILATYGLFASGLGVYVDTNSKWFNVVGSKIVNQCFSQSIVPNIMTAAKWPIEIVKQTVLKNRQLTQKKLNKLFEGPEYPLSKRYANMLNIMFVIMTYASAIPMLYMFGVIYFALAYWCDKVAILRGCTRPAQYDEKLAMTTTDRMSVAMAVHLLFGTWFFGYIDADNVTTTTLLGDYGVTISGIITLMFPGAALLVTRVSKTPAFFMFAFMLLWAAFELFMRTIGPPIFHIVQQRLGVADEEFKEGNPSFFEALENQELTGLDTYNIKKNPRYRDAFSSEIVEVDDDGDDDDDADDDFGQDDDED